MKTILWGLATLAIFVGVSILARNHRRKKDRAFARRIRRDYGF